MKPGTFGARAMGKEQFLLLEVLDHLEQRLKVGFAVVHFVSPSLKEATNTLEIMGSLLKVFVELVLILCNFEAELMDFHRPRMKTLIGAGCDVLGENAAKMWFLDFSQSL